MNLVNLFASGQPMAVASPPCNQRDVSRLLTQVLFPRAKALAPLSSGPSCSGLAVVGALLGAFVLALLWPTLPSLESSDRLPAQDPACASSPPKASSWANSARNGGRSSTIRDVPDVMKQAILAAEDERFYQHGGVDYLSVVRAALRQPRLRHPAGRRDDHDAGRPQLLPDPREDDHPQAARGAARLEDRSQPVQGRDPRALRQPDLPRAARLRLRRRRRRSTSASRSRTSPSPRRRCSPACRRRRPPFNPVTNPKRAKIAPAVRAAPDARAAVHHRRGTHAKHKMRHWPSARACAKRSRSTPSSSPRWRGRWSSTPTAKRPTRSGITV